MYVGPLLVGLGVTVESSDWELGYFTRVAQIVRRFRKLFRPDIWVLTPDGRTVFIGTVRALVNQWAIVQYAMTTTPALHVPIVDPMHLQVGGSWLGWWMVSAAAISQIGQFEVGWHPDLHLRFASFT